MALKEFKTQSIDELKKLLAEQRNRLRVMRFKVAQRQLKKVHEIKTVKKEIARLLTFINQGSGNKQTESK